MSLLNYLPEKSEYATKFAAALKPYENSLFVIGSNARKTLYGLKTDVNDYNFLCTDLTTSTEDPVYEELKSRIREQGFSPVVDDSTVRVDCESFAATIRVGSLEDFLFGVRFAGDGLAVRVSDGRPVVLPEYMTLPPVVEIRKIDDHGPQKDKTWLTKQLDVLGKFQDELFKAVNATVEEKTPNVEPVQST